MDSFLDLQRAEIDDSIIVLTKWKGFSDESNSWEPLASLYRDVPAKIRTWLEQQSESAIVREALAVLSEL